MRRGLALLLVLATGVPLLAGPARAGEVAASAPTDLSVTVYRSPYRRAGGFDLDQLGGFALVTETRTVHLPAGESRLRFEGVADGIDPSSAIVTGLPSRVIEKNRDAHLLSPSALVAMAVGKPVELVRTRPKGGPHGGEVERIPGRILSDAEGGVVFETAAGIEALRCSGLPETLSFEAATTGLSATPTLSVLTRTEAPVTATVTLSYLARGFDWAADYVATLSKDGGSVDLGAWLTLANANGTGFPSARAQVVAGRLNRVSGQVEPIDVGEPILASCWPRGSTSDSPEEAYLEPARPLGPEIMEKAFGVPMPIAAMRMAAGVKEVVVTGSRVSQEQLGDLKLYRTPSRTTVAARQAKQVRLLDQQAVPVQRVYEASVFSAGSEDAQPAAVLLRTRNDKIHHLGLPLPSGRIALFQPEGGRPMLVGETTTRDLAEDEEVEWRLGPAPDIQVTQVQESRAIDRSDPPIPLIPGLLWASSATLEGAGRVEIRNAGDRPRALELSLVMPDGVSLVAADRPAGEKNGKPIFRLTLPPNATTVVRYRTGQPAVH